MGATEVLSGLSSEDIVNVRAIIENFALACDTTAEDVYGRLPVFDIMAIQTKHIHGQYFERFANTMNFVNDYEGKITDTLIRIQGNLSKNELTKKDASTVRYGLRAVTELRNQQRQARKELNSGNYANYSPPRDAGFYGHENKPDSSIYKEYPAVMKYLDHPASAKHRADAITYIRKLINDSRIRKSTVRRREFRRAIVQNHQAVLEDFLPQLELGYPLHLTRLDRIVVDVYHPNLLTFDTTLKRIIKEKMPELDKELSAKRLPSQNYIDALFEYAQREGDETIDNLSKQFQKLREDGLEDGVSRNGKLTIQRDGYKVIITFDPEKTGAPIRLRLIANVQSIIQHELFRLYPEKEEIYRRHCWVPGSEMNFIMPEDYDFYYSREQAVCEDLENKARSLFLEEIPKRLNVGIMNPFDTIVYVSQWEVCWEEEFTDIYTDDPLYLNYKFPGGLAKHLNEMVHKYQPYVKSSANYAVERETERPTFHCDVPSMNPQLPMMQYKVYPKFRNMGNNIMLRHEYTATRFFKEFGSDAPDGIPIASKVLSNPAYCRELMERLFQLEFELNGVEGLGYNPRYQRPPVTDPEEHFHNTVRTAVFGKNADQFTLEYTIFRQTGEIAPWLSKGFKERMRAVQAFLG